MLVLSSMPNEVKITTRLKNNFKAKWVIIIALRFWSRAKGGDVGGWRASREGNAWRQKFAAVEAWFLADARRDQLNRKKRFVGLC